jgi:putative ABC transport system permease protein
VIFAHLAYRNVIRRRERSLLTLIGVLLAVACYVSLLSVAEGLYQRVKRELDGRNVDVYLVPQTAVPLPTGPVGTLGLTTDTIALERLQQIAADDRVRLVTGVNRYQWTGRSGVVMVLAINPESLPQFFPLLKVLPGGRLMAVGEMMMGQGLSVAEGRGVGSSFQYGQYSFKITGVVHSGGGFQDYFAYLGMDPLESKEGVHEVWVQLQDPARAREFADWLNAQGIPRARAYTRREYLGAAYQYIRYAWLLQFAIASIGVLISMTAAMNTMLMSTYERLREFATLRAIGASRATVVQMVLAESVMLCATGGAAGTLLGILGARLVNQALGVLLQLSFPLGAVTWWLVAQSLVLSVFVGLVGAVIPGVIVWKLNIVEGLRWD